MFSDLLEVLDAGFHHAEYTLISDVLIRSVYLCLHRYQLIISRVEKKRGPTFNYKTRKRKNLNSHTDYLRTVIRGHS